MNLHQSAALQIPEPHTAQAQRQREDGEPDPRRCRGSLVVAGELSLLTRGPAGQDEQQRPIPPSTRRVVWQSQGALQPLRHAGAVGAYVDVRRTFSARGRLSRRSLRCRLVFASLLHLAIPFTFLASVYPDWTAAATSCPSHRISRGQFRDTPSCSDIRIASSVAARWARN